MRKQSIMALAVVAMMASQASAADLPRKAASAPLPPPPPPYVWTGCYIGGNVGGAFAHIDVTNVSSGASGSRTSEYQLCWWRSDRLRLPVLQFVGGRHSQHVRRDRHSPHQNICRPNLCTGFGTTDTKLKWFDALTGRLGYLVAPNWLIYGQGGAAWTKAEATAFNGLGAQVGSISGHSRTGWTAGGGVEWMFVPHWSLFLEYNYMGFGTRSSSFPSLPCRDDLPDPQRQSECSGCPRGREL